MDGIWKELQLQLQLQYKTTKIMKSTKWIQHQMELQPH